MVDRGWVVDVEVKLAASTSEQKIARDDLVGVLAETLVQILLREHGAPDEPRLDPSRRQRRRRTKEAAR